MRYTGPKAKKCRRYGTNIFGSDTYDKIMQKKPYPAGKGPRTRLGRPSEYGKQLLEKQKARDMFCISEKQFHRLYKEASASKNQTGDTFLQLLERRLDNTIYRAGFAFTRMQARQFISHGLFTVNGVRVTTPSFRVKPGMVIAVREKSKNSPVFGPIRDANEKYMAPVWLKANPSTLTVEVMELPSTEEHEKAIDVRQVVEYYSRR